MSGASISGDSFCLSANGGRIFISVVVLGPTGLGLVRGLDPASSVLWSHYDEIVARYISLPHRGADGEGPRNRLSPVPNDWEAVPSGSDCGN